VAGFWVVGAGDMAGRAVGGPVGEGGEATRGSFQAETPVGGAWTCLGGA
jgi:hypothetical protein